MFMAVCSTASGATIMTSLARDVLQLLRTSPIFAGFALLTLAATGVIGLITFDVINMGSTWG